MNALESFLRRAVDRIVATEMAFAALLLDGQVVTWGHESYGGDSRSVQARLRGVTELVATAGAFAALASGCVVVWGDPSRGGRLEVGPRPLRRSLGVARWPSKAPCASALAAPASRPSAEIRCARGAHGRGS